MPKFDDLEFTEDPIPVDMANIPEQAVQREPPPQPGPGFEFLLPQIAASDDYWDFTLNEKGERRVVYDFADAKALIVVKSMRPEEIGKPVRWRLSAKEQASFFEDQKDKSPVSDFIYLAQAIDPGVDLSNQPNAAYANWLIANSGARFKARLAWNITCSKDRDVYMVKVDPATGQTVESGVVPGRKGCGQRYGLRFRKSRRTGEETWLIPHKTDDQGNFTAEWSPFFDCIGKKGECGARLNVFVNLSEFAPPDGAEGKQ